MPGTTEVKRIELRIDTLARWTENNPVINKGEVALISDATPLQFKVALASAARFSQLPTQVIRGPEDYVFMGLALPTINPTTGALGTLTANRKTQWVAVNNSTALVSYVNFNTTLQPNEVAIFTLDRVGDNYTTTKTLLPLSTIVACAESANETKASLVRYTIPAADPTNNPSNTAFELEVSEGVCVISAPYDTYVVLANGKIYTVTASQSLDILAAIRSSEEQDGWWFVYVGDDNTFHILEKAAISEIAKYPEILVLYVEGGEISAYEFVTHNNKITIS